MATHSARAVSRQSVRTQSASLSTLPCKRIPPWDGQTSAIAAYRVPSEYAQSVSDPSTRDISSHRGSVGRSFARHLWLAGWLAD